MQVRILSVAYRFSSMSAGLEPHYQELREAMTSATQSYSYPRAASSWRPPMDMHETSEAILIKVEVAGLQDEDIGVALYPNALVVDGIRRDDDDHDEATCFHAAQVRYGLFHVEVALPAPIQPDEVEATYRDGFLRIRLPKATPTDPQGSGESSRLTSESADPFRWQARRGVVAAEP